MRDDVTAVAVVCGERRVDVLLPAQRPVGEVLANLVALVGPEHRRGDTGWALLRPAGETVPPDASLASAGVLDGELLLLVPDAAALGGRPVDDAARALGIAVAERPGTLTPAWRTRLTTTIACAGAGVALVASRDQHAGAIVAALVAVALLGAATSSTTVRGDAAARALAIAADVVAAGVVGWAALAANATTDRGALGAACMAIAASFAAWRVPSLRTALALAAGAFAGVAGAIAPHWQGRGRVTGTAGIVVVALAVLALAPRLSFAAARGDRLDRGTPLRRDVIATSERGRLALAVTHAFVAGACTAACTILFRSDARWSWVLALCAAVLLALRVRLHRHVDEIVGLVAGAAGVALAAVAALGARWAWRAVAVTAAALAVVALASLHTTFRLRPLVRRRLAAAELVVAIASVLAALASTGWIERVLHAGRG